ncbi:MAG: signal peptidase I [Pyrinomonadaceae bacterium]|nr:signal peptidase I [Pyrinomonadaceae bacterium]
MIQKKTGEKVSEQSAQTLPETDAQHQPHESRKSIWREYFELAITSAIMAMFVITFAVQTVAVPTGSMQNTILIGDRLLVNKFIFAPGPHVPFLPQREIRRGDIIVFKWPGNKDNPALQADPANIPYKTNYLKRVIGLPGDRLEVRGARVLINDQPLSEHTIVAIDYNDKAPDRIISVTPRRDNDSYSVYYNPDTIHDTEQSFERSVPYFRYGTNGTPVTIPANHYFVMGDNRDNSLDSRAWGFVPRELVIGRPAFVLWSYDESAPSNGNFLLNFIRNTRWSRSGTIVR